MTQTTETQTQTTEGAEPDFLALVVMMVAAENAEIRDLPVTGNVISFPSIV